MVTAGYLNKAEGLGFLGFLLGTAAVAAAVAGTAALSRVVPGWQ